MAFVKSGNTNLDNAVNKIIDQINYEIGGEPQFKVVETKANQYQLRYQKANGQYLYFPTKHTTVLATIHELKAFNDSLEAKIRAIKEEAIDLIINGPKPVVPINDIMELTGLPEEAISNHPELLIYDKVDFAGTTDTITIHNDGNVTYQDFGSTGTINGNINTI